MALARLATSFDISCRARSGVFVKWPVADYQLLGSLGRDRRSPPGPPLGGITGADRLAADKLPHYHLPGRFSGFGALAALPRIKMFAENVHDPRIVDIERVPIKPR